MPKKFLPLLLLALLLLEACASRRIEVLRGSRRKYPISSFWTVYAAAQNLLQRDGFIVNLNHQGRGILVATLTKSSKQQRILDRISNMTGASFRPGDQLHVLVTVSALPKNKGAEMRLSLLRERENEWTQEDGDEIGNFEVYEDFFGRVDKVVGKNNSPEDNNPPG